MSKKKKKSQYGLIVIGYQGIGKTTIAQEHRRYIDLESSVFKINGRRDPNWAVVYSRQAVKLASQGYVVFVSSHKVVRDEIARRRSELVKKTFDVVTCYPAWNLKYDWIDKLEKRYYKDRSEKNSIAYLDAESNYDEEITSLSNDNRFDSRWRIDSMSYDLYDAIKKVCRYKTVNFNKWPRALYGEHYCV